MSRVCPVGAGIRLPIAPIGAGHGLTNGQQVGLRSGRTEVRLGIVAQVAIKSFVTSGPKAKAARSGTMGSELGALRLVSAQGHPHVANLIEEIEVLVLVGGGLRS